MTSHLKTPLFSCDDVVDRIGGRGRARPPNHKPHQPHRSGWQWALLYSAHERGATEGKKKGAGHAFSLPLSVVRWVCVAEACPCKCPLCLRLQSRWTPGGPQHVPHSWWSWWGDLFWGHYFWESAIWIYLTTKSEVSLSLVYRLLWFASFIVITFQRKLINFGS